MTKTYRPKTRTIPRHEFNGIFDRIQEEAPIRKGEGFYDTSIWMLDDEFQPTQNMASVRWIMNDSVADATIFQVDNAGDAILLIRGD